MHNYDVEKTLNAIWVRTMANRSEMALGRFCPADRLRRAPSLCCPQQTRHA